MGGSVGRRVRVKAILLSGARKQPRRFQRWLRVETVKGLIPAVLAVLASYLGSPVPLWAAAGLIAASLVWMCGVLFNALSAALRMTKRHQAFLAAAGLDMSLGSLMRDKEMWAQTSSGATLREVLTVLKSRRSKEPAALR